MRRSRRSSSGLGLNNAFKSPLLSRKSDPVRPSVVKAANLEDLKADIGIMQEKCDTVDAQIAQLRSDGYKESELEKHVQKLHEYNEIKDAAQIVFGQLAVIKGTTVKEIHENYGINCDTSQ